MATKLNDVRVVLVGCGSMARAWVETARQIDAVSIVGLVDIRREAAEAMAQKFSLPPSVVFGTLKQALAATGANVVFDVTVPEAHDAVTLEALKAGCHVLGEKPMSDTLAKARKMSAAAKKAKRVYAVIQNRRYEPNIVTVRNTLAAGKIGAVEEVHADFYLGAHFGGFRDAMDYPLVLDMAIHTFDAARFISGADPVSVYCHSFNPKHSWYKGDASAIVVFEMSDGIVFSYRGSWCAEGMNTTWESGWRVIGSQGSLLWDGGSGIKAQAVKPDGKKGFISEMMDVPIQCVEMPHKSHAAQIRDFVDCLRTGRTPQTICHDNIKSVAMVLAAVQSAKLGRKVKVKW